MQKCFCNGGLQRAIKKPGIPISFDDKINTSVAQIANPIKENDVFRFVQLVLVFHRFYILYKHSIFVVLFEDLKLFLNSIQPKICFPKQMILDRILDRYPILYFWIEVFMHCKSETVFVSITF